MTADLTNVRRKIARAKGDLDELRLKVTVYMNPVPYRVATKRDGNDQSGRIYVEREPDPEWGLDVGQIAIQARSALDLLVRQLVIDGGNEPARSNQFPIFTSYDEYTRKGRTGSFRDKHLRGVAKKHRQIIDSYQPYQSGKPADRDPLAILATIANQDKHRDIHAALGVLSSSKYRTTKPDGSTIDMTLDKADRMPYSRIIDGMELLGIENSPAAGSPSEKVNLDVTGVETELVFEGDRIVSLDDVERGVLRVAEIVERFAKRLSA